MSLGFAQIIRTRVRSMWQQICDRIDIDVKHAHIDQWKAVVAHFMKANYLPAPSKRLRKNLLDSNTRFGLSLGRVVRRLVPTSPTTRKADLAEAVCCLSFEKLFGITVPYYRWANKSHIEMPEHGIDVLAFKFHGDPSEDIVYLTEAKWRNKTPSLLNIINRKRGGVKSTLSNLSDLNICDQISLLLKRIENDTKKSKLYYRIFDFLDRFGKRPKQICIATFFLVDSKVDLDKSVKALSPLTTLPRKLISYNHLMDDLELVTTDVFRVMNA